jgi:hypothetical protein
MNCALASPIRRGETTRTAMCACSDGTPNGDVLGPAVGFVLAGRRIATISYRAWPPSVTATGQACEARGRSWRGCPRVHAMAGLLSGGGGVTASVFPCRGGSAAGPRHLSPAKGLCGWSRQYQRRRAVLSSPRARRQTVPVVRLMAARRGFFE